MTFPDLPAILISITLAPILLLAPGFFWSLLVDIDPVSGPERAAWSLVLSLVTVPALSYNFFRLCPYNSGTIWAFASSQTAVPALLYWRLGARSAARVVPSAEAGSAKVVSARLWIFPAAMVVLALLCLMDMERGVLLYRSYPMGDYPKHIFVTDAVTRTGVHPINPVFHPGRPLPLFYYFFWHLICSMVDGLSGWRLGPGPAVEGMTAWGAAALFAVVLLLACRILRPTTPRTVGICWALLFATGLDLLGYLFAAFVEIEPDRIAWRHIPVFLGAVDSWNWIGQVTSWLETVLWVPQQQQSSR